MEIREMGKIEIGSTPTDRPMRQMLEEMLPLLHQMQATSFGDVKDEDEAIKYLVGAWIGIGRPSMFTIKVEPEGSLLTGEHRQIATELIPKIQEAIQKMKSEELQ